MSEIADLSKSLNRVRIEQRVATAIVALVLFLFSIGVLSVRGAAGPSGPQGIQGVQGPQGVAGAQGPQGVHGPQGVQGPQGPVGPSGRQGLAGEKGTPGKAAISLPIGAVIGWPGEVFSGDGSWIGPKGWMLCDGREVDVAGESDPLYVVMRDIYGNGSRLNSVVLPNYAGYFLRGFDASGVVDLDRKNAGHGIGTSQTHALAEHSHGDDRWTYAKGKGGTEFPGDAITAHKPKSKTDPFGGSETRPVNVAINWIIRIR